MIFLRIARIKNIDIKLNISTLLIIGLVGYYAASLYLNLVGTRVSIFELIFVGLLNGILILASILAHELMHSILAQHYGLKVSEIELYVFGGVSKIQEEPKTPKTEFLIAIVGPATSFIIGISLFLLYVFLQLPSFLVVTFYYIGSSNIILGAFNFLPAFPMDGGRVLRAYLWNRRKDLISATKTASKVGVVFGYVFIVLGFAEMLLLGTFSGFWFVLIGSFLISSARKSVSRTILDIQLSSIRIGNLVRLVDVMIPFNTFVSDAIQSFFVPYQRSYFAVSQGDQIIGTVHAEDIKKMPLMMRTQQSISSLTRKLTNFPALYEDGFAKEALTLLNEQKNPPRMIVVVERASNKIRGFLKEEEIWSALSYAGLIPRSI